jgi:hypothetical protein
VSFMAMRMAIDSRDDGTENQGMAPCKSQLFKFNTWHAAKRAHLLVPFERWEGDRQQTTCSYPFPNALLSAEGLGNCVVEDLCPGGCLVQEGACGRERLKPGLCDIFIGVVCFHLFEDHGHNVRECIPSLQRPRCLL